MLYVPITGLVCTSPQMVDGDLKTSDTVYIEGSAGMGERTVTPPNSLWADVFAPTTVNLPTECNVRMVVLHGENLRNFKVLARDGKEWKELERFQNNRLKRVVLTTSAITDAIRIIATFDFGLSRGRPRPEIQEIEVYGIAQEEE